MRLGLGLIIDIALIVVIAIILITNTKKGFLYSVTVLTGKLVSLILAFFLSNSATFIFERPVHTLWEKTGVVAETLPWVADVLCVILAFILCVIIVRIIFKIIASATSDIGGKLGTLNHVLGFVLGLVIAFVAVQLIAVAVYLVGMILGTVAPEIGSQITSGTKFTRWVYEHNVLIGLFRSIFNSVFDIAENAFASIS